MIEITTAVLNALQEFKDNKLNFVIVQINIPYKRYEVKHCGGLDSTFNDFVQQLPYGDISECCFGLVRVEMCNILVVWQPETAKIKDKMYLASSKDSFKKLIPHMCHCEIAATDPCEIRLEDVMCKVISYYEYLGKARLR